MYLYDVDKELLDEMLTMAYIYSCGDQYSYYYTAEQWQKQQDEAAGKSAGVGVYVTTTESDEIQIIKIMQNSPASRAGLQENDVIVSVDGKKVKDIGYDAASAMIGGEVGTEVVLEILRAGEIITVTVIRDYYDPQSVFYEMLEGDGKRLGYVKITEFMSIQTTGYQFKNAVEFLTKNGAEGLIFDLRDNGGGDLYAILYILDYLLPEGPLVHIHYAGEKNPTTYYSGANEIDIPMTVLTNGKTASAAELFTAALRDYNKAQIVGTKTYGKGCGQSGQFLSDGSVVFITNYLYNPPYSENYDGIGIYPDHEVSPEEKWEGKNSFLIPLEEDTQLQKAAEILAGTISGK